MKNINLSNAMKLAHAEGRHPGWHHINASKDRMSYPEKFFQQGLSQHGLLEKYTIEIHYPIKKYFLDFAVMELKLDIEIDGCQHFRSLSAIEHDKIRDAMLLDEGWTVYRIKWDDLSSNPHKEFVLLLSYINDFSIGVNRYYANDTVKQPKHLSPGIKIRKLTDEKWAPYIDLVKTSNIDFTKYGWAGKVATVLGIQPQGVNRWMKRYMPDVLVDSFQRNRG